MAHPLDLTRVSPWRAPRWIGRQAGFTLLEMLVCITILAVAVFPLLLIKEQSITEATDSKLSRICRNQIQKLLSQAIVDLEPDKRMAGTLEDAGYPGIVWEVECEEIDLSTEVSESSERNKEDDGFNDQDFGWKKGDSALFDDEGDSSGSSTDSGKDDKWGLFEDETEIDPRFRYRHLRITLTYWLGTGEDAEEVKVFAETYVPPLPEKKDLFSDLGSDLVPPNTGGK
ncbi:MAG: type II secretion system protein [Planctomycetota bacterium]